MGELIEMNLEGYCLVIIELWECVGGTELNVGLGQILSAGDGGLLATAAYTYWIAPRILQVILRALTGGSTTSCLLGISAHADTQHEQTSRAGVYAARGFEKGVGGAWGDRARAERDTSAESTLAKEMNRSALLQRPRRM
jgi:hypothetical protein